MIRYLIASILCFAVAIWAALHIGCMSIGIKQELGWLKSETRAQAHI